MTDGDHDDGYSYDYRPDHPTELEDFSSLTLSDISPEKKSERKPRKVLHFSDGTIEEYSTDDEVECEKSDSHSQHTVDPESLTWGPWISYWASRTGKSVVSTCDYIGEGIANFLGITSQKYFYEIEEYKRQMKEEAELKKEEEAQMAGWITNPGNSEDIPQSPDLQYQFIEKNFDVNKGPSFTDEKKAQERF